MFLNYDYCNYRINLRRINYMEKFIVKANDDAYVYMTIRIKKVLQEQYTSIAGKANISRNQLINEALEFALDNMEIQDENGRKI